MTRTLSLRELRQNPTSAMDAIEAGKVVVITRRNRPIADLVPHRPRAGATPRELAAMLTRAQVDAEWERDLAEQRGDRIRGLWNESR